MKDETIEHKIGTALLQEMDPYHVNELIGAVAAGLDFEDFDREVRCMFDEMWQLKRAYNADLELHGKEFIPSAAYGWIVPSPVEFNQVGSYASEGFTIRVEPDEEDGKPQVVAVSNDNLGMDEVMPASLTYYAIRKPKKEAPSKDDSLRSLERIKSFLIGSKKDEKQIKKRTDGVEKLIQDVEDTPTAKVDTIPLRKGESRFLEMMDDYMKNSSVRNSVNFTNETLDMLREGLPTESRNEKMVDAITHAAYEIRSFAPEHLKHKFIRMIQVR